MVTKANVLQSDATSPTYFKYSSTALTDRITTVQVTYVNSLDVAWLPTTTSVQDATGVARYGYQVYDLSAFGATTEGQAMRAGRYYMFTTLFNTETVDYDTGIEGFNSNLYDVIDVFDDDYAGAAMGGRIVSATPSTVTVDQPITISGSVSKISVKLQDGVTYETHTITNAPGTYTTFNLSGVWSVTPTKYCTYGVTSAITPRQFRIVDLRYDNVTKVVSVTAQLYNKNNYAYVESGYAIQAGVYTQFAQTAPLSPTNLVATPSQYIDTTTNTVAYAVTVSWDRPASQNVSYKIRYRKDNAAYIDTPQFTGSSYDLTHTQNGTYQFLVYSYNIAGNASAPATISYTQDNTGGGTSLSLAEITNLTVQGGGTAWTGTDLNFTFINPAANQGLLKDFVVTLKTTGGTLLRSVTVPGVAGGQAQGFIYTYQMNNDDTAGVPNRSVVVKVQGQDSSNNTTTGITATLTNAAPPVPSNIASSPGQQSTIVSWTPETGVDIAGYIVWSSATSGFTPSSGNAIDCGMTALASINGLAKSTNYFYRVAAYDIFGKSLAGTGLNVSSQLSFTTPSSVGVSSGSTLPVSGMVAGDTFFLTTTSTLYKYTGTAWVAVGVQEGSTLPGTGNVGDVFFLTTDNKLYRYTGTAWIKAVDGADITANSILANSVVTGTLTSAQIAASTILGSNIVGGTITGSLIAAATITGGNIVASTITAGLLNVSTLSAITANVGTLTAGLISNNSGTNTINLSATGATAFISTPGLSITAAGTATFSGILSGAIVTAANCSIGTLSAITANVGTLTAGLISNNSGTNTINLSATGATPFISTPGLTLTAAGAAAFAGTLSAASGTFAGTLTAGAINAVNTINIAGNAVTSLATAIQVGTFGFTAAANVAAFYDNTSCSVTFTLAFAATVVIQAIIETDLFDGSVWTLGAWNTGALGLADIGIGSGDTSAVGYVKVDSTYMTNTQGTFTVGLAAGSHTIKVASHVDTTTSAVATTSRMVNGQIIAQWGYR